MFMSRIVFTQAQIGEEYQAVTSIDTVLNLFPAHPENEPIFLHTEVKRERVGTWF
jgi:hypothetical protein